MKSFAALFRRLDRTTGINLKIAALADYFSHADDDDKLWMLALFTGRRVKGVFSSGQLRELACEKAGLAPWLFEECYSAAGDLAETIALILPPPERGSDWSLSRAIDTIISMRDMESSSKKETLFEVWNGLEHEERFLFNKLLTGGFRVGVSQKLVCKALAPVVGLPESTIAHRLMGEWSPQNTSFSKLMDPSKADSDPSRPFPFYLAYALEAGPEHLGDPEEWMAEWKWDGIRGQLIRREGQTFLWSRGEELVTERFPEIMAASAGLPDGTVLDGEILAMNNGSPLPFQELQKRINRRNPGRKLLSETPVVFMTYDLLELQGEDLRTLPLLDRRRMLEQMTSDFAQGPILLSGMIDFKNWTALIQLRQQAGSYGAEGLMLKRYDAVYQSGRRRGDWWKWKLDPMTIDAVMIYAQAGHGRRAGQYTDYTFALWDDGKLVPFAKAYSGLTDEEIRKVDAFVKKNTREKFGPVRSVEPRLVFELGFEGVNRSTRHKSGVAVRFPRILRWRTDKEPADADTLQELISMIRN